MFVLAFLPFLGIIDTHPKLPCASVHAAANHEAITWFKDMQGARHGGVSHGTHKDRHILCQTVQKKRSRKTFQTVLIFWRQKHLMANTGIYQAWERNTYSESSLVSSRWVLVLSAYSWLKYCLITVSNTVVTMYFLHARYWREHVMIND